MCLIDIGFWFVFSMYSSSYALHIAAQLSAETNVDKYFELIEDIVAQADEVDDKYLQVKHICK